MKESMSAAGRGYLRTFVATLIVFGIGISSAPELDHTYLYGVAALVAVIAAGARFLQAYLSWATLVRWLGEPYGDYADSFVQGFLGSIVVTLTGWQQAPDLNTSRAFIVAALVGAFNAAARAVQGALTTGEYPGPAVGLKKPESP